MYHKNLNISITNDPRGKLIIYSESVDNNACRKNKFDIALPLLPPFWPTSTEIRKMQIFPQPLNVETKNLYILDLDTKSNNLEEKVMIFIGQEMNKGRNSGWSNHFFPKNVQKLIKI